MKLFFLLFSAILFAKAPLWADETSKAAKAREVLKLSNARQASQQIMDLVATQVKTGISGELAGTQITPTIQKQLDAFLDKTMGLLRDSLGWEKMEPDYARIYVETFSEEELDGLVAFYKSPAGQAMVTKMPQIIAKSGELGQKKVEAILPKIGEMAHEFAEQLKK